MAGEENRKENGEMFPKRRQEDQEVLAKQRHEGREFSHKLIESLRTTKVSKEELQVMKNNRKETEVIHILKNINRNPKTHSKSINHLFSMGRQTLVV